MRADILIKTPSDKELLLASEKIKDYKARYPQARSSVMPALYIAQKIFGYLDKRAISFVAQELQMPEADVVEVATFYTMYYKKPVGKYHFQICRTLSCMLCGSNKLVAHLKKSLNLKPNEVSEDGIFSYEEVECLGSCGTAPVVQVNDVFFENLEEEHLAKLLERLRLEDLDLRFDPIDEKLGEGMPEHSRSQILKG